MPNQDLLNYINNELAKGIDKQTIINSLLSKNWQQSQIDEVFTSISSSNTQLTQQGSNVFNQQTVVHPVLEKNIASNKKTAALAIFLVLAILLIGSAGTYYVFLAKKFSANNNSINIKKGDSELSSSSGLFIPISPSKIGLTLTKDADNTVTFSISNLKGYVSGQYDFIYSINGDKEKQTTGKLDLTNGPFSKTITIGSCTNNCKYFAQVVVTLTDTKGGAYGTTMVISNVKTPTIVLPNPTLTTQNLPVDPGLKNASVEFLNANIRYQATHNTLPWAPKSNGGSECNNNKNPYEISITDSMFNSCVTALINDGELKMSFTNTQGLNKIFVTSINKQDISVCFEPESLDVKKDPSTKYNMDGTSVTNPQTSCDGYGGPTVCYWCAK